MKTVIENPYAHAQNDYIKLTIEAIRLAGYRVVEQTGNIRSADYVIYNWTENIPKENALWIFMKKIGRILLFKLMRTKIIWVMHNRRPHENSSSLSLTLMRFLCRFSDRIMILSDATRPALEDLMNGCNYTSKISKVPMVNYTSILPGYATPSNEAEHPVRLLLFGRLEPYKCIDVLIEAVESSKYAEKLILSIVGTTSNHLYLKKIQALADKYTNVNIINEFVTIDHLAEIVKSIDLFALPADIESSLNSSAVMMAFSMGRTVISPDLGTIREYKDYDDFVYAYHYDTRDQHVMALRSILDRATEEYLRNRTVLEEKGRIAYERVSDQNSIERVSQEFEAMFESL